MPASRTRLVAAGFFVLKTDLPINASFVAASEPVMPHLKKKMIFAIHDQGMQYLLLNMLLSRQFPHHVNKCVYCLLRIFDKPKTGLQIFTMVCRDTIFW
jgi:hypothetical protein